MRKLFEQEAPMEGVINSFFSDGRYYTSNIYKDFNQYITEYKRYIIDFNFYFTKYFRNKDLKIEFNEEILLINGEYRKENIRIKQYLRVWGDIEGKEWNLSNTSQINDKLKEINYTIADLEDMEFFEKANFDMTLYKDKKELTIDIKASNPFWYDKYHL